MSGRAPQPHNRNKVPRHTARQGVLTGEKRRAYASALKERLQAMAAHQAEH